MGRPKIDTPIQPQTKIKEVLSRPKVQRTLAWLSREARITYPLLHQIVNGKRRLQDKQANRILHALNNFGVEVAYDEVFID
tara:strand:- start:905 stop:1147 length:243 start_codon:yes stop_codon:yes gene_type:complete